MATAVSQNAVSAAALPIDPTASPSNASNDMNAGLALPPHSQSQGPSIVASLHPGSQIYASSSAAVPPTNAAYLPSVGHTYSYPQYTATAGASVAGLTNVPQSDHSSLGLNVMTNGAPVQSISRHQSLPSISSHANSQLVYSYPVGATYSLVPASTVGSTVGGYAIRPLVPFQGAYPSKGHVPFYDPFQIKHRRRTSQTQLKVLEKQFDVEPKPDPVLRKSLADQLEMTPREVQFQNRRAKQKKLDREKLEGKKPSEKLHKKASTSPIVLTTPLIKSSPASVSTSLSGNMSGEVSPNENTPPATSSSPGGTSLAGTPTDRRGSCPTVLPSTPSDHTAAPPLAKPKSTLFEGVTSSYLLPPGQLPDRRYSLPENHAWTSSPYTASNVAQFPQGSNMSVYPSQTSFQQMYDSVERAHARQPEELATFAFPGPPQTAQTTHTADASPGTPSTISRPSTGAYSSPDHTFANTSSSSLMGEPSMGSFTSFRLEGTDDDVAAMANTFNYPSDASSVSSGGYGHAATLNPANGTMYPPGFDPSRRSSCPAEFMADFGQMGFGNPAKTDAVPANGQQSDWTYQQQQTSIPSTYMYAPSSNDTYLPSTTAATTGYPSYTVQSYLASLPPTYPDPQTSLAPPPTYLNTDPNGLGSYYYNKVDQFGRRNSTPALPSIQEAKVWDGKMSSLGWEKQEELAGQQ
ncbi:hypothetical protein BT69DRAFT_37403 [Atractiella rhizophila]|nr:hypothetical protein BT69DRAFT_37403 [Atractiella rhizophila]